MAETKARINPFDELLRGVDNERDHHIIPIFDYPADIRRAIYTTNVIESLNYSLKKLLKTRGVFPTEDALKKVLYLAIMQASQKWTMPIRNWKKALNRFAQLFGARLLDKLGTPDTLPMFRNTCLASETGLLWSGVGGWTTLQVVIINPQRVAAKNRRRTRCWC